MKFKSFLAEITSFIEIKFKIIKKKINKDEKKNKFKKIIKLINKIKKILR